ncbi:MAG: winged helix-turn-helix transcriptional regulator [Asgard group archaeon]|nr:winged helix-turn-helix transcriptional regulator [Asgard group archaeon]
MSSKRTEMDDEEILNSENASSAVKIVTDPEKIKILVDPMRRKILGTMREGLENEDGIIRKEMTVPEIARKLGVSAPKCYHHLDLLVENGFVRVAKEEKKKRTSITYYERTSPAFVLASSIDELERKEGIRESPLIMFINEGFMLGLTDKEQEEAQKLIDEFTERNHKYIIKAAQQFKGKIPDERMRAVLGFVSNQYASQDKRCIEIRKELNKYLKIDLE